MVCRSAEGPISHPLDPKLVRIQIFVIQQQERHRTLQPYRMKIVARCQLKPGQAFQPAFPRSGLGSETVASRIDEPQCPIGSSPRSQHSFLNAGTGPRRREESFSRIRVKRRVLARNAQIPPESRFLIRRSCRPHSSSSLPFHVSVSLITYLPCYVRFHSLLLLFSNPLYYRLACPLFNHSIISLVHFYNQNTQPRHTSKQTANHVLVFPVVSSYPSRALPNSHSSFFNLPSNSILSFIRPTTLLNLRVERVGHRTSRSTSAL
jgi:hypothetical protein